MRASVIVPARYASSRFPGKPLTYLLDKPLVVWVAEVSSRAVGIENTFVATDDTRIADLVAHYGYKVIMTSSLCETGTDRLAEACEHLDYDLYINVQGDEPLVSPVDIQRCIRLKEQNINSVINGYSYILPEDDPLDINMPKVLTTENDRLVYISRSVVPGFKQPPESPHRYKKQVCIYGYTKSELLNFSSFGRKSFLESCEDIEILRFIDIGSEILMFECSPNSLSVDVPEDIPKVEILLKKLHSIY